MAKNKIEIQIKATEKDVKKVTRETTQHLGKMGKAVGGLRKGFLSLGTAIKGAFVAGAAAMTAAIYTAQRIVRDSISAASALEEVQNKFNVVFKDQIEQAEKLADVLRESYLMSEREAKQYLSSVQDLLVPMGMAADRAGELSFEIVKLAADLGSFNNLPTAQVMENIQSALTGEYESMKKYGIILNATVVQQRALDMGLAKNKDSLTAAQKAQAAYNVMLENSAAAIGDVSRSSGSYANQVKQYKANLEDLRVVIGTSLLPTVTDVVSKFNEWVKANDEMIKQRVPEYINAIGKAAKFVGESIGWWLSPSKRREDSLVRQITDLEAELKRLESWEPNFINRLFGQEKDVERIEEVRKKIVSLKAELRELWAKQGEIVSAGGIKKAAEEQEKQAEAAKETEEALTYVLDGVKHTVGQTEKARGNFVKMKTATEEVGKALDENRKKMQEEIELLKKEIELLRQRAAIAREPGIKSYPPGMQTGGAIPGWGGGDRHIRALEGGEEVLDKYTAQYARQHNLLAALRGAARGGGERGYFVLDHRFQDGKSFPVKVNADEVGAALIEYVRRGRMAKGKF